MPVLSSSTRSSTLGLALSVTVSVPVLKSSRSASLTVVAASIPVHGDARLLHVMLRILLENAWKFTAAETAARIEVSSRLGADGQRETDFSDNGAGFDMTLAGKLFVPFQRLHTPEQFAGTGIGLAIVDAIVRRHGGSINAESVEGAGSTFTFELPIGAPSVAAEAPLSLPPSRLLVVDDQHAQLPEQPRGGHGAPSTASPRATASPPTSPTCGSTACVVWPAARSPQATCTNGLPRRSPSPPTSCKSGAVPRG